jgi:hypothetical protein
MIHIALLYNKSNTFGLKKDVDTFQNALKGTGYFFKAYDPLEPPVSCDIAIHFEVPVHVWIPWAKTNILIVNPEWYVSNEWNSYLDKFNAIFCKDSLTSEYFRNLHSSVHTIRWALPLSNAVLSEGAKQEFVWFLGGSQNKRAMVPTILNVWDTSFPPLTIYATKGFECLEGLASKSNIQFVIKDLTNVEQENLAKSYKGHIGISRAEGFGYTAAEAEQLGAFCILNNLPCYTDLYTDSNSVDILTLPSVKKDVATIVDIETIDKNDLQVQLKQSIEHFQKFHTMDLRKLVSERWNTFSQTLSNLLSKIHTSFEKLVLPPVLVAEKCPSISVVTLVHNRPKFVQNACFNLLTTDYPKEKIEWIVVDDSEPDQSASDRIIHFQQAFPGKVTYIPLVKKTNIGKKRNLGVSRAAHDIVLMMDDDDHYPVTSFRRRVAWLLKDRVPHSCSVCTTIAMYDLLNGKSAVNSPPFDLGLSKRCSEATLTFHKNFWRARGFPEDNIAEGEGFLAGRESEVVEMPPQQIIVAFSHGTNISSRKLPAEAGQGCFWGFEPSFLKFIHGLVGVSVEEDS